MRRKIQNIRKDTKKLKLFITMLLVVGSIVNGIIITLYNVDKSVNLDEISKEMSETKDNLSSLNEKISASDSLINFLGKSNSDGFVANSRVLYFNQADSLAQVR